MISPRSTLTALLGVVLLIGGFLLVSKGGAVADSAGVARSDSAGSELPVPETLAPLTAGTAESGAPGARTRDRDAVPGATAERTRPLVVLVRNADGRPVDDFSVRVGVGDRSQREFEALWERTDGQGLARFAAADVARVRAAAALPLRVELGSRTHEPVVEELEPGVIPAEPVVLEVDMLRVVVRALTPEGEPWIGRTGLLVRPDDYHYDSTAGPPPRIGWVPRGHGYELEVYRCGLFEDATEHFPAPLPDEAQREHDIVLGPAAPALSGRFVGPEGGPLAEGTSVGVLDRSRASNGSRWISVERDGRFEYALRLGEEPGQLRVFEFTLPRDGQLHEYGAFAARVTCEVGPPGEPLDLGTIVLEGQPLLVAGRVTAPEGVRLKGIGVEAQVLDGGTWGRHPALDNCVWISAEGEFAIYGEDLPGPGRLHVFTLGRPDVQALTPGCDPGFTPGARDLVVPLVAPGTLTASFDPVGLGAGRRATFRGHVRPEGSKHEFALPEVTVMATSGVLEHQRIPPGRARLELLAWEAGAPIAEWHDLEIRAGETTDLGVLVLDGSARMIRLRLGGASAANGAPVQVRYAAHGTRPLEHRARIAEGVAELVVGAAPLDVLVFGEGIAPQLLESVSFDMDVELEAGVGVNVRFKGAERLVDALRGAEPERRLRVEFEPSQLGHGNALPAQELRELAASRIFSFSVPLIEEYTQALPGPGEYVVRVELPRAVDTQRGRATPGGLAKALSLPAIRVEAGADPASIEIDLLPLLEPVAAVRYGAAGAEQDGGAPR